MTMRCARDPRTHAARVSACAFSYPATLCSGEKIRAFRAWLLAQAAACWEAPLIDRFNEAAGRNDVETFLSLFAPDARNFHFRGASDTLGGGPSKNIADAESRGRVFRTMFAERPARIEALDGFALGEWVVSHDRATQQDGTVAEGLSLYCVQDGRIVDDWYLAQKTSPS